MSCKTSTVKAPVNSPVASSAPQGDAEYTEDDFTGDARLCAYHLDVGQGDCTFIELPNGESMLIDSGDRGNADMILSFLRSLSHTKIDYLVITHPHLDHIGSMEQIVRKIEIGKVYMPKTDCATATYESLLNAMLQKGLKIKTAKDGVNILSAENLSIDIISPTQSFYDLNNSSAVLKITYGDTKLLYMGDAEKEAEQLIKADVSCDVIKVGHHGSDTSSSKAFAKRTNAKYAIISVGQGNSYGHPKQSTLKLWQNLGAKVYRTDEMGTIIVRSTGKTVIVSSYKANAAETPVQPYFVLNTSSYKIHTPECSYAKSIRESNRLSTGKSIQELEKDGYTPCKVCNPH